MVVLHHQTRISPHGIINIGTVKNPWELKIDQQLIQEQKHELSKFLKEYQDVFALSYKDMPRQATDIVMHKLAIKLEFTPIKQKLRKLKPEWSFKVKEEVIK